MKKTLILFLLLFYACSNDDRTQDPVLCTEEARPGIEVTVKDTEDNMFLVKDVTVVAVDNEYRETLKNVSGTNIFIGAYERTGNYTVVTNKTNYVQATSDLVIVTKDDCHVITKSIEVFLNKK
ncbi:hypothetical protein [Aquimarina muelleri]|uniref:Uncharacterized protein n=1 Tax=Aquimarina muelleri TaxID=279356 RepID=A0A918N4L2_9FLAO|nr:hypothetical protein [Aquimarina muelleri]MCX2763768.1 hypothetical protein [Aquimarina muelleri]GGX29623.1 hypothetical protein GCM10007384_33460 [Aquimarina muelleri]